MDSTQQNGEAIYISIGPDDRRVPGFVPVDKTGSRQGAPRSLAFASGSVAGIFTEGHLERLDRAACFSFLRECRRVLRPGGLLRIATPDLDAIVGAYTRECRLDEGWKQVGLDWIDKGCEKLNAVLCERNEGWIYNETELARLGRLAGLMPNGRRERGISSDPKMTGLEIDETARLILEFVKQRPIAQSKPLVSVIITAFNPRFFRQTLESALSQTYEPLEIVIGDDCPDLAIREIVDACAANDPRIRYQRNEPRLGGPTNRIESFQRACGSYIKFLNDDDLLHPDCVRRMALCLVAHPNVTLVTSHRRIIDADGNELPEIEATRRPVDEDSLIDGSAMAGAMLADKKNFIGEPSTVMFRRADLEDARPHILSFAGRPCIPNADVTMWTHLLAKGDGIYLVDSLSSFRKHPEQMQAQQGWSEQGMQGWNQLVADAQRYGLVGGDAPAAIESWPLGLKPWWPIEVLEQIAAADAACRSEQWNEALEVLDQMISRVPEDPWLADLRAGVNAASRGESPLQ